jgi:predicted MFS family arabinose efflux permease
LHNAGRGGGGIGGVARDPSARRWAVAELVAYSAWTAELTYAGAFYIQSYGVSESAVGFLLAGGSVAFLASTLSTHRVARRVERRRLIAGAALAMGALLALLMNVTPSVVFTLAVFCLMAVCAGLRSTGSSALGLSQLPAHPGSMMAARTVSAQLGYMVGAVAGGVVLAVAGFGTLGLVLFAGMAFSALLVARVSDPTPSRRPDEMRTAT